jgi:sugar phosphate isomerase/epimerase
MKIACPSASFGSLIERGDLTQLEWLDVCANELEVDGVVFDAAHFPRTDDEYLAQLKKTCVDLGLTVAALAADDVLESEGPARLASAVALGAPLVVARAPATSGDPGAWSAFTAKAKARAQDAKLANVTLAIRNEPGSLCAVPADLRALAKDVDSSWLRFALDPSALATAESADDLLPKTVIAVAAIPDAARFATPQDRAAPLFVRALARFRGFVVLESPDAKRNRTAYHEALERFASLRANALLSSAFPN